MKATQNILLVNQDDLQTIIEAAVSNALNKQSAAPPTEQPQPKYYYSTKEAAVMLNLKESTIRTLHYQKRIKAHKTGKNLLFTLEQIQDFLNQKN